jgi:type IV secretion system protein VirB11
VLRAGTQFSRDDVRHYMRSTVDAYVQPARDGGRRRVAKVLLA